MRGKYFSDAELSCKCGCGLNVAKPMLVDRLDVARFLAGIPFVASRGGASRCERYNIAVGGKDDSSHLDGFAVDILTLDNATRFAVLYGLIEAGFTRIGVYRNHIHADCDTRKSQRVCWYDN